MTKLDWTYPTVRRDETVKEELHGHIIADPYRWLEDPESEETKAFVEAQNNVTFKYLANYPKRDEIKEKLTKLYDFERTGCPFKRGEKYYLFHNSGLQAQSILYQLDSLTAEKKVFFDPNVLEKDGTAALTAYSFTRSGKLFGYGISRSGSDWKTLHVRCALDHDLGPAGTDLSDEIHWAKFTGITWSHDERGFFYGRYPEPGVDKDKAGTETGSNLNAMLYYHRLGTSQDQDQLVLRDPDHPHYMFGAEVTDDGRWLIVTTSRDCDPVNNVWIAALGEQGQVPEKLEFIKVVNNFEGAYEYIANDGKLFYFKTNKDAPRYKIVTYHLDHPERGFVDLIPEHEKDVLDAAGVLANNLLYVHYLRDVKSALEVYRLQTGEKLRSLPIPIGSIVSLSGRREDRDLFFKFSSYLNPGVIYRYNADEDQVYTFQTTQVASFDSNAYETKQVFVRSKDGVQFPMFITARKDIPLDGSRPALLYGYGGFSIALQPAFSPTWAAFLQHFDGVVAIANLRGGNEYGEAWHRDGMLHKKQNVFDDFQSAAAYLSEHKYTQPQRLTIVGGSNGGLLVGACVNQAPKLFGCGLAAVGVMDMLRFHKFTIGHAWMSDYGNPDVKEDFEYLLTYSPLHNVRSGVAYPAMLLTTSDHDDRVVPLHSYKLIAELQHKLPQNRQPLMLRVETKAGHGAGKPTTKQIEEWADKFAFMALSLNLTWKS